uniref:Rac/Cdc42 guanine nucleotide exchange factor 6 n=1 Tax=Oncorhynchus kisutch TaxID=8019 RepID=A0A8C7DI85_ONCKI
MNPEEQTVTWLISLGVLNSPKKNIADPEEFLKTSLKDGVVLCKLMERLVPGSVPKYCQDPRNEADCIANIKEFLRGCTSLKVEGFEPECLYTGENFNKVLTTLLGVNFATQGHGRCSCLPLSKLTRILPNQEMSENGGGGLLLVKARFQFKQNNEDELSFNKGDLIGVSRQEEGGWWEGTLNGKTGWFPSNYVREVKPCDKPVSPKATQLTKNYYSVVVQDIQEHERDFVKELQTVLSSYLRPLLASDKLSVTDSGILGANLEEILTFQQGLVLALEECTKVPESQQRVAACYLNLIGQIRMLYLSYCSSHPSAVCVLTDHSEELGTFMESQGASTPGILTLTTSLSKPFMRLDKYPVLLQELERHVEEAHPDYSDILKATVAFKSLVTQCQDLRKRKNLELQILSEPVRGWEGDGMKSLGHVAYMSQVHMQNGTNEEKEERYLMMFPSVLVMLSASPRMSGFIYQGRLPLTGSTVSRQTDDTENGHYAFDITGSMFDRVTVICSNPQELQDWLDHLNTYTKGGSPVGTIIRSHLPIFITPSQGNRGPLEPPKTTKPWSLSCLRPAPPLKPSAALGYKERMSYILKDSGKSPRPIKKFLPKRKTERKPSDDEFLLRKSTAALEEDAQILKVIESYCTGASLHQNNTGETKECVCVNTCVLTSLRSFNGYLCMSRQESKWIKQCLEDEQKSRKELERVVRKLAKQKNDCAWEDGDH